VACIQKMGSLALAAGLCLETFSRNQKKELKCLLEEIRIVNIAQCGQSVDNWQLLTKYYLIFELLVES